MKSLNQAQALMQTIPFQGQGFDKCREIADGCDGVLLMAFINKLHAFLNDSEDDQISYDVLRVIKLAISMHDIWNDPELERIA